MLLKGKKILVTGASSGIGMAAAKLFSLEGASVALAARRKNKLDALVAEIKSAGGIAVAIEADISRTKGVTEMMEQAVNRLAGLDGAFNNAGTIGNFSPMLNQSEQDWDETINVNLKSVWFSSQWQMRYFQTNDIKGSIVNTSSWLASGALCGSSVYSASKAGIDAFVRAAAIEVANSGIRINSVNPGGINTEMTREAFNHDKLILDMFSQQHPAKRLGEPTEVAELACWLLSERASFVNGQAIHVDSGYTIGGQRGS
ncbi:SDR family oxidoreductase [Pseudoalteromonas sp. SCSIO 43201]|uniref:SDR family NAD(P)-dependent oxidoreductase n=1 Tax=Pseudoalteromonas sp. SCSIO 43201 TaxID=2822842 RepID=UPI0020750C75|nr:SDR family oxidoreductase [Pseudoalteromonas sp. SCSIO 43201]USD29807.1 SDR family oxidoreductase [Pseudoalteromonas sp. SCSIO 43201]